MTWPLTLDELFVENSPNISPNTSSVKRLRCHLILSYIYQAQALSVYPAFISLPVSMQSFIVNFKDDATDADVDAYATPRFS